MMKFTSGMKCVCTLLCLVFLLNSCTEEKWYERDQPETKWNIQTFTVEQGDWIWDNRENCFYYEWDDFDELTNFIAENGVVVASLLINKTYQPLEVTTYTINEVEEYYSETVKFEYRARTIKFKVSGLDLFQNVTSNFNPSTMNFKVTLIW